MPHARSFSEALRCYLDRRVLAVFVLGISSGFPWVLIGSAMTLWLKESGLSRAEIGYFGAIFVAYSINFCWSPLIDRIRLPLLARWLGLRRGWILLCQLLILGCCLGLGYSDPGQDLYRVALIGIALAFASATQDIAIDAFRIDSFHVDEETLLTGASAMATAGWWTGYAGLGFLPLWLSDQPGWSWPLIYQTLALLLAALTLLHIGVTREPDTAAERHAQQAASQQRYLGAVLARPARANGRLAAALCLLLGLLLWQLLDRPGLNPAQEITWLGPLLALTGAGLLGWMIAQLIDMQRRLARPAGTRAAGTLDLGLAWLLVTLVEPIHEFFKRNGVRLALSILLFIFLFKIGEAFLGRMSVVFYKEIGFSNTEIGLYSKLLNWWVTILFSILGGLVNMRFGIIKGLLIGGVAMGASNLMFSLMALVGPNPQLFMATILVDGFTSAWSTVAFVSFLSQLCNRSFTASQYALMASIGTLGRTLLASLSGLLVDLLDGNWSLFFLLTALMVIPSLLLLISISRPLTQRYGRSDARCRQGETGCEMAAGSTQSEQGVSGPQGR